MADVILIGLTIVLVLLAIPVALVALRNLYE
jgi:hypothetical protein